MAQPNLQVIDKVDTVIMMLPIDDTEVKTFLAATRKVAGVDNWLLYNRFSYLPYVEGSFAEVMKVANVVFAELVYMQLMGNIFKATHTPDSFYEVYDTKVQELFSEYGEKTNDTHANT